MIFTKSEIQAYTIARMIQKDQVVIVGTGLPLVGAIMAKKAFQPSCTLLVESGLMDFNPSIEIPRSVSDLRSMAHCAVTCPPFRYLGFQANELKNNSQRLIGFIGGAAVDIYGNVSATSIGDYYKPKTRFPGSGGANGIASFVNTIIMMKHEKRRFVNEMSYITSPGWLDGPEGRAKCGLPTNRGPMAVVSDLGVMKFDDQTKKMYLYGYYSFTNPQEVIDNTSFEIDVSRAIKLPDPDTIAIRMLHKIDPDRIFL
ncbi:CoA-transferase [Oscillospiraceae bacterium MB24-C1]|nr:CoA-transferase [Oscillospiraceae bacterium MB24-C1]